MTELASLAALTQVISDEQRALNKALHDQSSQFGNRSDGAGLAGNLPAALSRMNELGVCKSILDYGTGKGKLVERLRDELRTDITVDGYDPAVKTWENKPNNQYDIVTCLDVLEHIDIATIDAVLRDIKSLTRHFCYLVIDLHPAVKTLADGRNAHILLAPPEWWVSRVSQLFACHACFPVMHIRGIPQKVVIAATDKPHVLPLMYGFLIKMKLFNFTMSGGPLGGITKNKNKKSP